MAPPEKTFPVGELENRVHLYDVGYKEKSRKLPGDFDLKRDCELYEMIQYSCTTLDEMRERALAGLEQKRTECYPFVRLFRHCKYGNHDFHVETTAWEGRHKWKPSTRQLEEHAAAAAAAAAAATAATAAAAEKAKGQENHNAFAKYGSYFWTEK